MEAFMHKMAVNLNILSSIIKNSVFGNVNGCLTITKQPHWLG